MSSEGFWHEAAGASVKFEVGSLKEAAEDSPVH
jgi:hypothetical protein